jgi:hypothetical protein
MTLDGVVIDDLPAADIAVADDDELLTPDTARPDGSRRGFRIAHRMRRRGARWVARLSEQSVVS